ncbi:MAG: S8 family serine peptidase [Firmicutes bacterium]|nr:S8 family serine peptidase [Bacillota bacterium]
MKKTKRLTVILGFAVCVLAVVLVMTANINVPEKNGDTAGEAEQASDSPGKPVSELEEFVTVRNGDGNNVGLEALDDEDYDGFMFTLKDSAPENVTDNLKNSRGIEYSKESNLYTAETLDDIENSVEREYLEMVEPDYVVELMENSPEPNDPAYNINSQSYQWYIREIKADKAWEKKLYGQYTDKSRTGNVTVAIVDSGLVGTGNGQALHEDINYYNVLEGKNFADSQEGTADSFGHGTMSAGIIAAKQNNGKGVAGIAPEVDILPVKIFGESKTAKMSEVLEGVHEAVRRDADVINMSFGTEGASVYMESLCNEAVNKGIILVASAGNGGTSVNNYPAAYSTVVGVGAIDKNRNRASFSQTGTGVYVTAPGTEIVSVGYKDSTAYSKGGGTSYSCPQVSALAALCKSISPDINAEEFMKLLRETSTDLGSPGKDNVFGYGLVNFEGATGRLLDENIGDVSGTQESLPVAQAPENISAVFEEDGRDLDKSEICIVKGDESENLKLKANAESKDGGEISYQWWMSRNSYTKGSPIEGASGAECEINKEMAGTYYYYVQVKNTVVDEKGNSDEATAVSGRLLVTIVKDAVESAEDIDALISGIGAVSLEKEEMIVQVRALYDMQPDSVKKLVTKLSVLQAAEKKLDELRTAAARPGTTTNVKAVSNSYNSMKITWKADSKAVGYQLYRATSKYGRYVYIGTVTGGNKVSSIDSNLVFGCKYYYKVRAFGMAFLKNGPEDIYGNLSETACGQTKLSAPTLSVTAGKKKATIRWNRIAGAKGYVIYRSKKAGKGFKAVKTVKSGSTVKYTNKKLGSKKTYYYKVRAYRYKSGTKKAYSSYSPVRKVITR